MSSKYTPLDNTEGSSHSKYSTPPSYELNDFTPGNSEAGNANSSSEPLDVTFHCDTGAKYFKLSYNPQRGVRGIRQIIQNKLNSMGIQVDYELYLIGVWEGNKFRLITCDEDRISLDDIPNSKSQNVIQRDTIHYFKTDEVYSITDATNRRVRKDIIIGFSVFFGGLLFFLLVILIGSHYDHKHGKGGKASMSKFF